MEIISCDVDEEDTLYILWTSPPTISRGMILRMSSTIPYEIPEIMYNGKRASGLLRYSSTSKCTCGNLTSTYFQLPYLTLSRLFNLGTPPVPASMIKNKVLMRPKMKMATANTERVGKLRGNGKGQRVGHRGPGWLASKQARGKQEKPDLG